MRLGVDFDNTIVCYDQVFHRVGVEQGLIPPEVPVSKGEVRDYLRQWGKEDIWIELQGYVYGARMLDAIPFPGTIEFFGWCKNKDISFCIISHRTRHPFIGPRYDLHQAAQEWVKHYGFYERTGLSRECVYFELTKEEKLERIRQEGCDLFIDDLSEFLADPGFPAQVKRILFDPNDRYLTEHRFERATSWQQIKQLIMNESQLV
jgi:hypothetical protein